MIPTPTSKVRQKLQTALNPKTERPTASTVGRQRIRCALCRYPLESSRPQEQQQLQAHTTAELPQWPFRKAFDALS
jgi:hypothetical protein